MYKRQVDDLTDEFRKKMTAPGALTKPSTKPKQKVYLVEDATADEIINWLSLKGFSCRYGIVFSDLFQLCS